MSGIRLAPYPSKYIVDDEFGGKTKEWSKKITYDDLLFAHGQHTKDYADLNYLMKRDMYSKLGRTLSKPLAPILEFFVGDGGVETIDENFARWRVYGQPERRTMSFGNPNGNLQNIGAGGIEFDVVFDVDWYKESDVLAPVSNKRIQIVLKSEGVPSNGAYKYSAILLDADNAATLPEEYLAEGEYWIKMGSVSSWEKAGTFGSVQFADSFSYIEFEVALTTMGWTFEIEAEADRKWGKIKMGRCNDDGQPIVGGTKAASYAELKAEAQIDYEKELFLTYGNSVNHLIDPNTTKQITTSPSLFEYLEEGNYIPYSPEVNGIDFIVDQIQALWYDRIDPANRKLMLFTGEAGLKLFSEWVNQKFGTTAAQFNWDFVLQKRTPYDKNSGRGGYSFGRPQFTEYLLDTFGSIIVAHWSLLDNTRVHGIKYPGSIYTANSYEFVALNIGFGESTIKMLSRNDNKLKQWIPGFWSPFGEVGMNNPYFKQSSYQEDSYKWICRESFGLVVMDPTNTLYFKPNVHY
jgi:hypothetical protein